jgi:hypothetical protein
MFPIAETSPKDRLLKSSSHTDQVLGVVVVGNTSPTIMLVHR